MSYDFRPMTDEELDTFPVLEDGIYDFEVLKSERKTSKSGNPMAELKIQVWENSTGKINSLFDYLVFSDVPYTRRKIKHFCSAVGLQEQYSNSSLPEDLSGLCGKLELGTQDGQPKPTGGTYPRKNVVVDYVAAEQAAVKASQTERVTRTTKELLDQDIPF